MKEFRKRLKQGRSIDWDFLLPYLAIPYVVKPTTDARGQGRGRGAPDPGENSGPVITGGPAGEASDRARRKARRTPEGRRRQTKRPLSTT